MQFFIKSHSTWTYRVTSKEEIEMTRNEKIRYILDQREDDYTKNDLVYLSEEELEAIFLETVLEESEGNQQY